MKTLLLTMSLLSSQPSIGLADSQWLDRQVIVDHVRSYLVEDVKRVTDVLKLSLREGLASSSPLNEFDTQPATVTAHTKTKLQSTDSNLSQLAEVH